MLLMSRPYVLTGRTTQKSRTRQALVEAAGALMAQGTTPTVEQAAAAAGISRPTAYRYFSSQRELLSAAHPELSMTSLLPEPAPADPFERLELTSEAIADLILRHELALRVRWRISLEPEGYAPVPLRSGQRILWIDDALAPLKKRLPRKRYRKLVLAIAATLGIEPFVWLVDVAGLDRDEAVQLLRWSARELLRAFFCPERDSNPC